MNEENLALAFVIAIPFLIGFSFRNMELIMVFALSIGVVLISTLIWSKFDISGFNAIATFNACALSIFVSWFGKKIGLVLFNSHKE